MQSLLYLINLSLLFNSSHLMLPDLTMVLTSLVLGSPLPLNLLKLLTFWLAPATGMDSTTHLLDLSDICYPTKGSLGFPTLTLSVVTSSNIISYLSKTFWSHRICSLLSPAYHDRFLINSSCLFSRSQTTDWCPPINPFRCKLLLALITLTCSLRRIISLSLMVMLTMLAIVFFCHRPKR